MEELSHIFEIKEFPLLSALFLGVIVAVSPCTVASNISVAGYLANKDQSKKKAVLNNFAYVLGRTLAYGMLGMVIFYFAGGLQLGELLQYSVGKIIGPLFIIIGFLMLDMIHLHGIADRCMHKLNFRNIQKRRWSAFGIGVLLAFAFCPYCAALYFGMLVPLSLSVSYGAVLPWLFGVGAAVPVFFMIYIVIQII